MLHEYSITGKNYHTISYYLKEKYKKKVFKVPLNASFSCPNRDGSKGIGGCLFCTASGSGDFAGNPKDELEKQFEEVKARMSLKWPDAYYIAYFQAYSNTYGTVGKLKENFEVFIHKKDVIGLSIATRCDCINEEIAAYLATLKPKFKEFWVELGLQSSKKETMKAMNLHYTYTDFKRAVKLLRKYHIDVIVHIINGLPNESKEDMLQTIQDINKNDIQGIKIHCLNIIENTTLGKLYQQHPFKLLSLQEYITILGEQLRLLKEDIIIHRIGADSPSEDLIAPLWISQKLAINDKIDQYLREQDIFQGDAN